jgi:hypothetical protein
MNDKVLSNVSIRLNNLKLDKIFNVNTLLDIKNDKVFRSVSRKNLGIDE